MSFIKKNYVYIAVTIGNIISFVAATALTWSSPSIPNIKDELNTTDDEDSWIGSLLAMGAIFGPFVFGPLADRIGRKLSALTLGIPFLVSYLILAFAKSVGLIYFARTFIGMGVGGVFTVIPMYIGEVAEDTNRGALGASMNIWITLGLLFSYSVGPFISTIAFNIILAVFPAIFMVTFFIFAPESPYYLMKKDKVQAEEALMKLRGVADVTAELDDIKETLDKAGDGSILDIFKSKGLRKAFIIGVFLVFFQQFSGINTVLFYAQDIFNAAGGSIPEKVSPIIIGVVQFFASFITPIASDRTGRKLLCIISCIGMLISEIPLGVYFYLKDAGNDVTNISWLPILSLIVYMIFYNVAMGPIPWAILGELFPSNVKSLATSSTASICWIFAFLITKFFSSVKEAIGLGPSYWTFAGFCLLGALFVFFVVIETKGKSLQEIQDELDS